MNKSIKILLFAVTVMATIGAFHVFGKRFHNCCPHHFKNQSHCMWRCEQKDSNKHAAFHSTSDCTSAKQKQCCPTKDTLNSK